MIDILSLLPLTAEVDSRGHLVIGGCDSVELVAEFGTPLYVFDELSLRRKCAEFKDEFGKHYPDTEIIYAAKAFINTALARLFSEEGLGLDVVSAGELYIAREAGFPLDRVYFHGNNKSVEELKLALEWRVGRIVVDNLHELKVLSGLARERGAKPDILLRLSPEVDPHTHKYIATGAMDSKFGFTMLSAEEAIARVLASKLNLIGFHFHIGSLIPEVKPYQLAIERVLDLAGEMKREYGFELTELDIGGGFAIQYTRDMPAPSISAYAEAVTVRVIDKCRESGLAPPGLIVEPGRAIVGQAGVALYRVGAIKEIPSVRCYVSVDGGMGDNIRPALYGARYDAVVANKMNEKEAGEVTIAGKFCESGDVLIKDISLPLLAAGDVVAIPASGAYCLPMASNYNASLKPAVIMVKEGKGRLIQRRETLTDLTQRDLA